VASPAAILVAARDEEERIGATVERLRKAFPDAEVIVADDGSRDLTAEAAERAGARVLRLPRRGKGQALTLGEREAPTSTATSHRWRTPTPISRSPSSRSVKGEASGSPSGQRAR
jgi:cellulose synthase/poly-beta-1,6-N-acetylglucosamine synthase-like glycosyltransferase